MFGKVDGMRNICFEFSLYFDELERSVPGLNTLNPLKDISKQDGKRSLQWFSEPVLRADPGGCGDGRERSHSMSSVCIVFEMSTFQGLSNDQFHD